MAFVPLGLMFGHLPPSLALCGVAPALSPSRDTTFWGAFVSPSMTDEVCAFVGASTAFGDHALPVWDGCATAQAAFQAVVGGPQPALEWPGPLPGRVEGRPPIEPNVFSDAAVSFPDHPQFSMAAIGVVVLEAELWLRLMTCTLLGPRTTFFSTSTGGDFILFTLRG